MLSKQQYCKQEYVVHIAQAKAKITENEKHEQA